MKRDLQLLGTLLALTPLAILARGVGVVYAPTHEVAAIESSAPNLEKALDTMRAQGIEADEEASLKEAYGAGYRKIDRKWREYVQNGFKL